MFVLFDDRGAVRHTHTTTAVAAATLRALRVRDSLDLLLAPSLQRGPALAEASKGRPHIIARRKDSEAESLRQY